jgi:nucleoside-diphosphate-sugar epimerase
MQSSVEILREKVGLYIYISSDSVYMVCKKAGTSSYLDHSVEEFEAVRPTVHKKIQSHNKFSKKDGKFADKLNKADKYGHGKLCCEEVLNEYYEKYKFPSVSLRLPDVYGPYDTSGKK